MNPNFEKFKEVLDNLFEELEIDIYLDLNRKDRRKYLKSVKTSAAKASVKQTKLAGWTVEKSNEAYADVLLNNMSYIKKVWKDLSAKDLNKYSDEYNELLEGESNE